ncbi:MAG: NAD-dependent epimerase/dehydratase family protein [Pseudomonadota bacterium]
MKILLTGASGVLGQNMADYLLQRGCQDLVFWDLVRSDYYADKAQPFIQGSILEPMLGQELLHNVDVVIHCASAAPSYPADAIQSIVVDGTRALLERAFRNGVRKFIYISSTAVYGIPDQSPVYEDAELQDYHDPYNRAKIAAEALCHEYRARGMCVPILRPRTFLGPGRLGTFALLNDWAKDGKGFPLLGSGRNRYQFLDVEDLCQAIYLCMLKDDTASNDTFNIGAKHFASIKEDYQSVLDAAGFGKKIVMIPAAPALWLLRRMEGLGIIPLYKRLYQKIVIDYYVSIDKAERVLGYAPRYSNQDTLVRCYRWYLANLKSFEGKSGNTNSTPWKQGALGLLKVLF